ncbi:hypothetical protein BGZ97_009972 [Linnemannia gamsii]|uniref:Uncharacterized protein n=1 Tax=Linnemannia gamsii TaxID=64522 RepID=A0A9P6UN78_9FUNG|nr:hypothetical protein BGZ97_009972 [Linnemannia gamsii]
MLEAAGKFIIAAPGTMFSATFVIDGIIHIFTGTFGGTSVEPTDGVVTLTYNALGDLTDAHNFSGVIGATPIKITLDNGNEITGTLTNPISLGNSVSGTGKWNNAN